MIDTIIFDVGRVLVNWDYESYLKRFAFGPEKTKAIAAATFEGPYWRQFDRGILTPAEIVKGFCSLAPEYTEEIKEVFAHCEETSELSLYRKRICGWIDAAAGCGGKAGHHKRDCRLIKPRFPSGAIRCKQALCHGREKTGVTIWSRRSAFLIWVGAQPVVT